MPRQREPRLMQFRRGRVELLTACPRGADLNPKHSPDRHHSKASQRLANEAKRREPKSGRIPGEQILSSTDAFIRAESWTNLGPNSAHRILKGLGSSNPPLSATESLSLGILHPNHRIARASGLFRKYVVAEKITFLKVMGNSRPA